MPDRDLVPVYVPANASDPALSHVRPGSGMVGSGSDDDPGHLVVDYEGNEYRASNISTYADRVSVAWNRHVNEYPTIARWRVRSADVVQVGWFDRTWGKVVVDDPGPLARWLGGTIRSEDLLTSDIDRTNLRYLAALPLEQRRDALALLPDDQRIPYEQVLNGT